MYRGGIFDQGLKSMPDLFLKSGATFSPCRTWRYALWRIWDDDKMAVLWIGLNPSTAEEEKNDPTVRRCMGFSRDWGYGGIFMLNVFAFRATDPQVMKAAEDPIGQENYRTIQEYHEVAGLTVAAWGVHGAFMDQAAAVCRLERISPHAKTRYLGEDLWCLDITQGGHPSHPLYQPANLKPRRYTPRKDAT